jgi:acetyl esterase/lipase
MVRHRDRGRKLNIENDVTFGTAGGRDLVLDIYRPPSEMSRRCAVIQLHGGAFRVGSRAMMAPRAEALSALGYVCLPADYRLLHEAPWPAQLHDVKAAIRWTRANADQLGIEADRIVIQGNSAGGHLALMAAGTNGSPDWEGDNGSPDASSSVSAAMAMYAPIEFYDSSGQVPEGTKIDLAQLKELARPDGVGPAATLLDGGGDAAAAASISPINHVSPSFPPTLLVHGLSDPVVIPDNSRRMNQALRDAGVTSDLILYDGQIHEFDAAPRFATIVAQAAAGFFDRVVVDPDGYEAEQARYNPFRNR